MRIVGRNSRSKRRGEEDNFYLCLKGEKWRGGDKGEAMTGGAPAEVATRKVKNSQREGKESSAQRR